MPQGQAPGKFELPPEYQVAKAAADIDKTKADAMHKLATANKAQTDAELAPKWAVHDAAMERAEFEHKTRSTAVDRAVDLHNAEQDRRSRMEAHNRRGGNA